MRAHPTFPLGRICEIISGATPQTGNEEYWGGEIDWVTPKDLSNLSGKYIDSTPRKITQKGLNSCSAAVLPEDSILLSSRAPIGHVAINRTPMATNQGFKSLIPNPKIISSDYLYYWLRGNRSMLENLGRGATFKEISKTTVASIKIPLPPLQEQRDIATSLDLIEESRTKRRRSIELLDDLAHSIFLELSHQSEAQSLPTTLGDTCSFYAGASLPESDPYSGQADGYLHIKVSDMNIVGNEVHLNNSQLWSADPGSKAATCPTGSVVFPKRGAAIATNKKRMTVRPTILDPNVMGIHPDPQKLDPIYLLHWLKSFNLEVITSGSSVPQLNKRDLTPLQISLPPIEEQMNFRNFIVKIWRLQKEHQDHLTHLDELFASVQQRAFDGTLWDDPDVAA